VSKDGFGFAGAGFFASSVREIVSFVTWKVSVWANTPAVMMNKKANINPNFKEVAGPVKLFNMVKSLVEGFLSEEWGKDMGYKYPGGIIK